MNPHQHLTRLSCVACALIAVLVVSCQPSVAPENSPQTESSSSWKTPSRRYFRASHEWALVEGSVATVGISDHAQAQLNEIVFVGLPTVGQTVEAGASIATVESIAAESTITSPLTGVVIEVNKNAEATPSLLNSDPYGAGWIYKIRITNPAQISSLLSAEAYKNSLGN